MLRALDVVIGRLQQLQDDVLNVLADIAGFGERRRILSKIRGDELRQVRSDVPRSSGVVKIPFQKGLRKEEFLRCLHPQLHLLPCCRPRSCYREKPKRHLK